MGRRDDPVCPVDTLALARRRLPRDRSVLEKCSNAPVRSVETMTNISALVLEVDDVAGAESLYAAALGLGSRIRLRPATEPTEGFRGFTLSLISSQPASVDALVEAAAEAGA